MADLDPNQLSAPFPRLDREDWREIASASLGGREPATLTSCDDSGIAIEPLYFPSAVDQGMQGWPGLPPHTRGRTAAGHSQRPWDLRQSFTLREPTVCNREIRQALEGGATSLELRVADNRPEARGTTVGSGGDLAQTLDGVALDRVAIGFDAGPNAPRLADTYLDLLEQTGVETAAIEGTLGLDPFAAALRSGATLSGRSPLDAVQPLLERARGLAPRVRAILVDGALYDEAGACDARSIACATATGVAYLRELDAMGSSIAQACSSLTFSIALSPDLFHSIAKLRAARLVWAEVVSACSPNEADPPRCAPQHCGQHQQARISRRHLSRWDAMHNLLRGTASAFAAVVGGADVVVAEPYDQLEPAPTSRATRLARNTQLLMGYEAMLHEVVDPAGGSAFVETLTQRLAERAWDDFQEIEKRGGMRAALSDGWLATAIANEAVRASEKIATRRRVLVGINDFTDLHQPPPEAPLPEPNSGRASAFPLRRLAEPFEQLRDAAASRAAHSRPPTLFLATLGDRRAWAGRVHFVRGLLAAGGLDACGERDGGTPSTVAEDFSRSGLKLVVLCSSEERYQREGLAALEALRRAGAQRVYWAGTPGPQEAQLRAAGLGEFLFSGCDVPAMLHDIHWHLGLAGEPQAAVPGSRRA